LKTIVIKLYVSSYENVAITELLFIFRWNKLTATAVVSSFTELEILNKNAVILKKMKIQVFVINFQNCLGIAF